LENTECLTFDQKNSYCRLDIMNISDSHLHCYPHIIRSVKNA
jgi:hypothetical protein